MPKRPKKARNETPAEFTVRAMVPRGLGTRRARRQLPRGGGARRYREPVRVADTVAAAVAGRAPAWNRRRGLASRPDHAWSAPGPPTSWSATARRHCRRSTRWRRHVGRTGARSSSASESNRYAPEARRSSPGRTRRGVRPVRRAGGRRGGRIGALVGDGPGRALLSVAADRLGGLGGLGASSRNHEGGDSGP